MIEKFENFSKINEGRRNKLDQLSSNLVREIFSTWVNSWKEGEDDYCNYSEHYDTPLVFFIDATLYFRTDIEGFEILPTTSISELEDSDIDDMEDFDEDEEDEEFLEYYKNEEEDEDDDDYEDDDEDDYEDEVVPHLVIDFAINPKMIPEFWHDMYMILCDTVRHEIEHLTQGYEHLGNLRPNRPTEDDDMYRSMINSGLLPEYFYLILPKEIDANLHGLKFESRKRHESMSEAVQRYLKIKGFSEDENSKILKVWRKRAQEIPGMPRF